MPERELEPLAFALTDFTRTSQTIGSARDRVRKKRTDVSPDERRKTRRRNVFILVLLSVAFFDVAVFELVSRWSLLEDLSSSGLRSLPREGTAT